MSANNSAEDIISALYDLVQDARAVPLAADKCILERDRVLDMLDELISLLPAEIKQARTIVESRSELIGQARKEAEATLRQAQEEAKKLVEQEAIYQMAVARSQEEVQAAKDQILQIRKAGVDYLDESLRRTEQTIMESLKDVQDARLKFRAVMDAQEQRKAAAAAPEAPAEKQEVDL